MVSINAILVSALALVATSLTGGDEAASLRAAAAANNNNSTSFLTGNRNLATAEVGYGFIVSHVQNNERWCITAAHGATNGANLRLRLCDFGGMPDNQMWRFDDNGKFHTLLNDSKCMVAGYGTRTFFNGIRMRINDCHLRTSNFNKLSMDDGSRITFVTRPYYCLTNSGTNPHSTDTIHAKRCKNRKDHHWTYLVNTEQPSAMPSSSPSAVPSSSPSASPSASPTTASQSATPSSAASESPSTVPTSVVTACTVTETILQTSDFQDMVFEFIGYPNAIGDVTLSTTIFGDYDNTLEHVTLRGEGNAVIGQVGKSSSGQNQCESPIGEAFTLSMNDFNSWNVNNTISIIADLSSDVHDLRGYSFGCQGYVELTLTYMTAGICPLQSPAPSSVPSASPSSTPTTSIAPSSLPTSAPSSSPTVSAAPSIFSTLCTFTESIVQMSDFQDMGFQFNGFPDAVGIVTLSTTIFGDFNDYSEYITLRGEGNAVIGEAGRSSGQNQCVSPIAEAFPVSMSDFNAWNADDSVGIVADLSGAVHLLGCGGYVEITLSYMTAGICPVPSDSPSMVPSASPSVAPSASPSASPSTSPTDSNAPSISPSASPSMSPTISAVPSWSTMPSSMPSLSAQPSSGELKVLVLASTSYSWEAEVGRKIEGTGLFSQVDVTADVPLATPSLATLLQYDSVLVFNGNGLDNNVDMGNVLADYVDSGGCLSIAAFALFSPTDPRFQDIGVSGRLSSGGYLPVTQGGYNYGTPLTLVPILPEHPLLEGVSSFNGGPYSYHNTVSVAEGATLVANWSNGIPLVAYKDNVVALNFFPPSSDSSSQFWLADTDGARLLANSLMCNAYM